MILLIQNFLTGLSDIYAYGSRVHGSRAYGSKAYGSCVYGSRKLTNRCAAVLLTLFVIAALMPSPGAALAQYSSQANDPVSLGYISGGHGLKPFKFIVATDSHFGSWQGNKNSTLAFGGILQHHSDAAFLIHMGDITETGTDEEYGLFRENTAGLPFPVLATIGNHESRWQDPQGSKFRNHFGPSTFSFDYGRWHFVVLDTTYPEQGYGTLDPSVLAWLDQDLASQPGHRPVALFSHHPLLYQERNFQDSDDALLEIIERYPVCAIFSGHGHSFIPWKVQGRSCFMSGALMDNAYMVVEAEGSRLKVYSVKPGGQDEEAPSEALSEEPSYVESLLGQASLGQAATGLQGSFANPVSELAVEVENSTLTGKFRLSVPTPVWFQIDGGYYNELGKKQPGTHEFSVDISAHAPGTHTFRIKTATGGSLYITAREFEKDTAGMVLWKRELGSSVVARMLTAPPSNVIAGTRNGMVYSIDSESGDVLWEYDAGAPWGGGVIDRGKLYFGTAAGQVHCIEKDTGRMTWKTTLDPSGFVEPPVVYTGDQGKFLIVGSSSGKVYALNPVSGITRWAYQASGAVTNTPSAGLGMVFFGDWDQKLYAIDAVTGEEVWVKPLGRQVYYSPAGNSLLYRNTLFSVTPADSHSGGSFLYALNPLNGQEIWKGVNWRSFMEPSLPVYSQKRAGGQPFILAPDYSGRITAYYQSNGEIPWHLQGYSTLFAGVPNLDRIYVTGGARGVLAIHAGNTQTDFKIRDTFLFVDPLVLKTHNEDTKSGFSHMILQGDNRGTIWAIRVPVAP